MIRVRHPQGFLDPFTRLQDQPDVFSRIAICSLILLIPVLGWIYMLGYQMEVMKRVARQQKHFLPDPSNAIAAIFREGLFMLFLICISYLIPIIGVLMVIGFSFTGMNFLDFLVTILLAYILAKVLSGPILDSAKMHYARTGNLATFLNIPYHAIEVLRNIIFHLRSIFSDLFFTCLLGVVITLLSLTVVGVLLIPFATAIYLIAIGYENGAHAQDPS